MCRTGPMASTSSASFEVRAIGDQIQTPPSASFATAMRVG